MSSSVGKRQREQQKRERAQAKAERRATLQAPGAVEVDTLPARTEAELIEDLSALHRTFEAGQISPEDFELGRDRIQAQFARLSQ